MALTDYITLGRSGLRVSPFCLGAMTFGIVSIVAAVVLLVHPGVAIVTVALVAGIAFLVRGAGELALGWRLRSITR